MSSMYISRWMDGRTVTALNAPKASITETVIYKAPSAIEIVESCGTFSVKLLEGTREGVEDVTYVLYQWKRF